MTKLKTIKLSDQELNDILNAIDFTVKKYPKKGATEFISDLEKLDKKLWKVLIVK